MQLEEKSRCQLNKTSESENVRMQRVRLHPALLYNHAPLFMALADCISHTLVCLHLNCAPVLLLERNKDRRATVAYIDRCDSARCVFQLCVAIRRRQWGHRSSPVPHDSCNQAKLSLLFFFFFFFYCGWRRRMKGRKRFTAAFTKLPVALLHHEKKGGDEGKIRG